MWMNNGDRKTKYLHAMVNQRRKKSKILTIQIEQGNVFKMRSI